jgi:hypothetical protein
MIMIEAPYSLEYRGSGNPDYKAERIPDAIWPKLPYVVGTLLQ